jgi:glycosyltransferase involved in cell wall biosynthesis
VTEPTLSVVVPTYRRPERIVACVDALAAMTPPEGGFEVVVVDDGSPDPVAPHLERFHDQLDLTVIRQGNAGPATARNTGAETARGRVLAFTDDDCRPHAGWGAALVAACGPGLLVGGRTVDRAGGPFARASQVLIDHLYDHFGTEREGAFFASNNLAVDRAGFLAAGGFDTSFPKPGGEDRELGDRWAALGHRHRYVPGAVVDHHHAMGWREFWRQHRTYGEGAHAYHRTRAPRVGHGPRPEPLSFYVRLVTRPLRVGTPQPWRTAALLVVSQVANTVGYATAALRELSRSRAGGSARGR